MEFKMILDNRNIKVYYQPIINVQTGELTSCEALMRVNSEERISPADLLAYAESSNAVSGLDKLIFSRVCRMMRETYETTGDITFHVNLSPMDCDDADIVDMFTLIADSYAVDKKRIVLELLETKRMTEKRYEVLRMFKAAGFLIGMDDYGTGYSGMERFLDFEFDCVKIDRSMLDRVIKSKKALNMYCGLVSSLKKADINIVQEGIEIENQYKFINACGVDQAQGYLFSKAISEKDFIEYVKKHRKKNIIAA